jgi:hypothetical protein
MTYYESALSEDGPMFARLGKFLGRILGGVFYWIGWGLAVIVIAQAVILSVTTGSPAIPVILGLVGIAIWLVGLGLKSIVARR